MRPFVKLLWTLATLTYGCQVIACFVGLHYIWQMFFYAKKYRATGGYTNLNNLNTRM